MLREAIILAGGFGTRLQALVNDVPKPMAPVDGKPFLDYVLHYLRHYGIARVVLSTGHLAHKISEHYGNRFENLELSYAVEQSPLGTGGGIRLALQQCDTKDVLVLNGDSFFDVDLNSYWQQYSHSTADAALALRAVANAARYGTIRLGEKQRISDFREKDGEEKAGLINGGVYILNKPSFLAHTPEQQAFSIEKDFFETRVSTLTICGFEHRGYFLDIGIPQDYQQAQHDFKRFTYR